MVPEPHFESRRAKESDVWDGWLQLLLLLLLLDGMFPEVNMASLTLWVRALPVWIPISLNTERRENTSYTKWANFGIRDFHVFQLIYFLSAF